jgi:hypothetical protein
MDPFARAVRKSSGLNIESGELALGRGFVLLFFLVAVDLGSQLLVHGHSGWSHVSPAGVIGPAPSVTSYLLQSEFILRRAPTRVVRPNCEINCFKPQGAEQLN